MTTPVLFVGGPRDGQRMDVKGVPNVLSTMLTHPVVSVNDAPVYTKEEYLFFGPSGLAEGDTVVYHWKGLDRDRVWAALVHKYPGPERET